MVGRVKSAVYQKLADGHVCWLADGRSNLYGLGISTELAEETRAICPYGQDLRTVTWASKGLVLEP